MNDQPNRTDCCDGVTLRTSKWSTGKERLKKILLHYIGVRIKLGQRLLKPLVEINNECEKS